MEIGNHLEIAKARVNFTWFSEALSFLALGMGKTAASSLQSGGHIGRRA